MMRLASYNVENLFDRARALNQDDPETGRPVLGKFARLGVLLDQRVYSAADKAEMIGLFLGLGMEKSDTGPFVMLRNNRGKLLSRPQGGGIVIVADGRADWVGQIELRVEPTNAVATRSTARVIADLGADVLGVIEAENRPALAEFNKVFVPAMGGAAFRQVMVIDGNDERGIDVGILTRPGFEIGDIRSHVDDQGADGMPVFSRDCAEYEITTPGGNRLLVMINHFKSKGFGAPKVSNALRLAQATRVKAIYAQRRAEGHDMIAVIGDFNDSPGSAPLAPLIDETDLRDASQVANFADGGFPGTFGAASAGNKIDYILLSPALFAKARSGGIFRKGMWPGTRPAKWPKYDEITKPVEAASDHGAIFVDLDV
jgi:endonuclease/exonuclease/phosphatase family metal-dependent hydrolase